MNLFLPEPPLRHKLMCICRFRLACLGPGSGLGIHTVNLSIRLWVISVFAVLPHSIRLMYLYQRLEIYVSGHVGMRRHEPNEPKTSACTHSLYLLYMRR